MIRIGIYKITNIVNKKIYIGSSNNIDRRWSEHKKLLKINKHHNSHLQASFNKYGIDKFKFDIMMYCTIDKLLFFEQKCLDKYKPWDREIGYNKTIIIEQPICTPEQKIARSKRMKMFNPMKNKKIVEKMKRTKKEKNYHHSSERKEEISKFFRNYFLNTENRKKQKEYNVFKMRRIERVDKDTGEIKEYESLHSVEIDGFTHQHVWKCCKNFNHTHKGYYWKYLEDK